MRRAALAALLGLSSCGPRARLQSPADAGDVHPYAREIAAERPVAHWRLDGSAPGRAGGAVAFDGGDGLPLRTDGALGGFEVTVEAWVRGPETKEGAERPHGTLLAYGTPDRPDALVISVDPYLAVTVLGVRTSTAIVLEPGWHHLAVGWSLVAGRVELVVDGRVVAALPWSEDVEIPAGGEIVLGEGFRGVVDEVAWYDRRVPPSALLGHMLVADGVRPPIADERTLPLELQTQIGHAGAVRAVDVSPDGTLALSGASDGARLWDLRTGRQLRVLRPVGTDVDAVAFAPDGRTAVTGGCLEAARDRGACSAGRLHRWDLATGALLAEVPLDDRASEVAFTPDGRTFLAIVGRRVEQWDVASGTLLRTLQEAADAKPAGLAVAPDRPLAAVGRGEGVAVFDLGTGQESAFWPTPGAEVSDVAFAPDGALVVALQPGVVAVADAVTGEAFYEVRTAPYINAVVAPDGPWPVVTLHADGWTRSASALGVHKREWPGFVGDDLAALPDGRVLAAGHDGNLRLWHPEHGLERVIAGAAEPIEVAAISPDGRHVLASQGIEGRAALWDLGEVRLAARLKASEGVVLQKSVDAIAFLPDGREAFGGSGAVIRRWRVPSGEELPPLRLPKRTDHATALAMAPDGRWLVAGTRELLRYDLGTGELTKLPGPSSWVSAMAWRPGTPTVLAGDWDGAVHVVDVEAAAVVYTFDLGEARIHDVVASPDGRRAAVAGEDGHVSVLDLEAQSVTRVIEPGGGPIRAVAFSPDGRWLATGGVEGVIRLWDEAGAPGATLSAHSDAVTELAWDPAGRLLSGSADGTLRLWDDPLSAAGAALNLTAAGREWVAWSDDGVFDASPNGTHLVAVVQGTRSWAIDQQALRWNRPDVLIERFGAADEALRAHLEARWRRRLREAGLDEASLADEDGELPLARIVRARELDPGRVRLDLELADAGGLDRYQVWVDDVPQFPGWGKPVSGTRARVSEEVALLPGSNEIEVSVVGLDGQESPRETLVATHHGEARGALWFVGFGVSAYAHDDLPDLAWAHQDALDLAAVLASPAVASRYDAVHTRVWTDAEVTPERIAEARQLLEQASVEDTVVLFVAGHGLHDTDAEATYYYLTHAADPSRLAETAADFEQIEGLLDGIAPRQKLFLLDTCQSGEDPDEGAMLASAGSRGFAAREVRGVAVRTAKAAPARAWVDRERFIYRDLARRTGAIVFSSSLGSEASLESDQLANGAFTEALLEALGSDAADASGDGSVNVDELRSYVTRRVPELTHDLQHPTIDRDNLQVWFAFPLPEEPEQPAGEAVE